LDSETGLQFNRMRYYDPKMGRWTSQDPLGFRAGDADLYRYVHNSPTNWIDPAGLFNAGAAAAGCAGGALGGGIAGGIAASAGIITTVPGLIVGAGIGCVGGALWSGFTTPDNVPVDFNHPGNIGRAVASGFLPGFVAAGGVFVIVDLAPVIWTSGAAFGH